MKKINKIYLIVVLSALAILGIASLNKPNKTTAPVEVAQNQEQTKLYQSKNLKLSVEIPAKFTVKDEGIRILVTENKEVVVISRNGTQFDSLSEYIKDFDIKHKTQVSNESLLTINDHEAISRIIKYPGSINSGDKIYFIYTQNAVYQIFTSSPDLFGDLDAIAQSFRYIP